MTISKTQLKLPRLFRWLPCIFFHFPNFFLQFHCLQFHFQLLILWFQVLKLRSYQALWFVVIMKICAKIEIIPERTTVIRCESEEIKLRINGNLINSGDFFIWSVISSGLHCIIHHWARPLRRTVHPPPCSFFAISLLLKIYEQIFSNFDQNKNRLNLE